MSINTEWLYPLSQKICKQIQDTCLAQYCNTCPYTNLCHSVRKKCDNLLTYFIKRGYDLPIMRKDNDFMNIVGSIQRCEKALSCEGNCQSCSHKEACETIDTFANECYKIITPYLKTT